MSNVYAMCDNCGKLFYGSINIKDSYDIKIEGNNYGKCEVCITGDVKSVDGIYSEIDNVMNIIAIDDGKDIEKLYNILKGVNKDTSIDEIENEVNEDTPQYKKIMGIIREWSDKNANVVSIAGFLMSILFFIYNTSSTDDQTEEYKNIIEQQQQINIQQREFIEEQNKIIEENENNKE